MPTSPLHLPAAPASAPPANLATLDAAQLGHLPAPPPAQVLVDCTAPPCQRTLGVCFLVSELLALRQSGTRVWLRNVSPVLRRCLHKLQLSTLFPLAE